MGSTITWWKSRLPQQDCELWRLGACPRGFSATGRPLEAIYGWLLCTHDNKVPQYFSRFWNPGTAGVDAFFQDRRHEDCLVVPPVVLLSKVLIFMFRYNGTGTLVVPYWPSAPFWPLLVHKFWDFVIDCSFFEGWLALRQDRNTNSLLGSAS